MRARRSGGFDSIWLGEHHNNPVLSPALLIGLAAVASRTRRIRLGTGVLLLPLYHPMMVAEESAMVDVISGGRLILGVGAGYAPEEFAAFGYSLKERGGRLEESAALLHRLWTEENVTHRGKYYQLDNATVAPRPLQQPRPPILVRRLKYLVCRFSVPGIPREACARSLDLFTREVMPALSV